MDKRIKFTMRFPEELLEWLSSKGTLSEAINIIIREKFEEEKSNGGNYENNQEKNN